MKDSTISLLVAGSAETSDRLQAALRASHVTVALRRADTLPQLLHALATDAPRLIIAEVMCTDFSAREVLQAVRDAQTDIPVMLLRGTGPEEIAIDCMLQGAQLIDWNDAWLRRLPELVQASVGQAESNDARRSIERRLSESEERYRDIFDNTSDLIQCLAPDGSFLYTNKTWRDTMGYSEEEVQRLNLLDVLHPDSTLCCQDRFARLKRGESLSCIDFKFVTKGGEAIHLWGDCGSIIKDGTAVSTRGIFRNVTDAMRAEEALRRSEARYQALYDNAPDIYISVNATGEILSINRVGARLLGYEVGELIGESASKIVHPEDQREVFAHLERQFQGDGEDPGLEYRKMRKDGSVLWVHQRVTREPGTDEPRLFVISRDITEKRNLEAQLAYQASHDTLTNLVNRREFERRLQRLLSNPPDPASRHALCFLDLDQFKTVNDTCGHVAGDELLRQIAALLQGQMRSRDTLARFGGDEFAVLMEHCSPENAVRLAEGWRETIEAFQFHWRTQRFSVGVSIGVVAIAQGQNMIDVLTCADAACYAAKKEGRNRVRVHSPDDPGH